MCSCYPQAAQTLQKQTTLDDLTKRDSEKATPPSVPGKDRS